MLQTKGEVDRICSRDHCYLEERWPKRNDCYLEVERWIPLIRWQSVWCPGLREDVEGQKRVASVKTGKMKSTGVRGWALLCGWLVSKGEVTHQMIGIHPKKNNVCGFCFSVWKNLRKKCVNSHDKISRQKCVNHQNKNNLVSTGIFVENILFLNVFIKK